MEFGISVQNNEKSPEGLKQVSDMISSTHLKDHPGCLGETSGEVTAVVQASNDGGTGTRGGWKDVGVF